MSFKALKQKIESQQSNQEESMTEEDYMLASSIIEQSMIFLFGAYVVYCKLNSLKSVLTERDFVVMLKNYSSHEDKENLIEENPDNTFYKFLNWYMNEDFRN